MSIDLICRYRHQGEEESITLINRGVPNSFIYNLPEDAEVNFVIFTSGDIAIPVIKLADVPLDIERKSEDTYESVCKHKWNPELNKSFDKLFYNYVGESEITVIIGSHYFNCRVNILATEENIKLTEEMLDYLDLNKSSMVNLCFSRTVTRTGGQVDSNSLTLTAMLRQAEKCIKDIEYYWPVFMQQIKVSCSAELLVVKSGTPNSNDAINWLAMHQSNIEFCNNSEQTLKIKNRSAKTTDSAVEFMVENPINDENLAVLSFFYHMVDKLTKLKVMITAPVDDINKHFSGYFSLDHVVNKYRIPVVKQMAFDIDNICVRATNLSRILLNKLGLKELPKHTMPLITPFVINNHIYRHYFHLINEWYSLSEKNINEDSNYLSSLRNLSTIYELCSILCINESLINIGFKLKDKYWRDYSIVGFGGDIGTASDYQINNCYEFISNGDHEFSIKLYYEPRIWRHNNALPGDPIIISREHEKTPNYYRSPDFLFRIKWADESKESDMIIMDAKYKSASNVRNYDISTLTDKYYFGIHQIDKTGRIGRKPVQAVWALYPKTGWNIVKNTIYANDHQLDGVLPVLPSIGGIKLKPSSINVFERNLSLLLNQIQQ